MLTDSPVVIPYSNLSQAWGNAFLRVLSPPSDGYLRPMLVSISDFDEWGEPIEIPAIRNALDDAIEHLNHINGKDRIQPIPNTAQTIFPHMLWTPRKPCPVDDLFSRYHGKILPRLKKRCGLNKLGTYFARMTQSTGIDRKGKLRTKNQLGGIIEWHRKHVKEPINITTQVTIRDPAKDHYGSARYNFPCLQQVSFARFEDELVVGAYYPTETIFERGYGNYLGLCRLGNFMAHEMELRLKRVNIFVLQPRRDVNKGDLSTLEKIVKANLDSAKSGEVAQT